MDEERDGARNGIADEERDKELQRVTVAKSKHLFHFALMLCRSDLNGRRPGHTLSPHSK